MITQKDAKKYLDIAQSLKQSQLFFDMHAHPFEVIYAACEYHPHPEHAGLFTTGYSDFSAPRVTDILIDASEIEASFAKGNQASAIARMRLSSLYSHTGPEVFDAHMATSSIDRILLLPVAPPEGSLENQMIAMEKMFPDREKYFFGWSVSNSIKNEEILPEAKKAITRFNIRAIKVHPGQTEINLASIPGKDRLENILNVCNQLQLPLIIHTGKCPFARNSEATAYSTIDVIKDINWEITTYPIVFAHAASYCCNVDEMKNHILPQIRKLMARNDQILMDISGIELRGLELLLQSISLDKILFGSDSLYEAQWQTVVKLLYALEKVSSNIEDDFLTIISNNPEKYIFGCTL